MEKRLHINDFPKELDGYKELRKYPHKDGFLQAMETEKDNFVSMNTWVEVPESHAIENGKKAILTRWVYKYKLDELGYLKTYRARLCVRGDLQQTQTDTYAATLAARIFRALAAIIAAFNLEIRQYDAVNAFPNSQIDELTYCYLPEGFGKRVIGTLLLLLRAFYGLKQSPALWYKNFSVTLIRLGLEPVPGVECLFASEFLLVFFFVDDIVVIYDQRHKQEADVFEVDLFKAYKMKALGELEWFLGIHIKRDRDNRCLWLSQASYIEKITKKFGIAFGRRVQTPLPTETIYRHEGTSSPQQTHLYQQLVGSINFAAVVTRPDIAYAASMLSEHLTNPSERHMELAYRVMHYLDQTRSHSICFDTQMTHTLTTFSPSSDASYADDPDTRKST